MRAVNKGVIVTTGKKVSRGAGMGLEVPCIYRFYGPKLYIDRLEEMLQDDIAPRVLRNTSGPY